VIGNNDLPVCVGRSCHTKHSSPYPGPSPDPGVIVGILISVREAIKSCREVGAGVVSNTLPAREVARLPLAPLDTGGRLSGGGEEAVAGIPRAGVDERDDKEGDNLRFLLDILPDLPGYKYGVTNIQWTRRVDELIQNYFRLGIHLYAILQRHYHLPPIPLLYTLCATDRRMFKNLPTFKSLPSAIGLPFLSSQEDAQLKFRSGDNGIKRLYSDEVIPLSDFGYWAQYYTLFNSAQDVYSLITIQDGMSFFLGC